MILISQDITCCTKQSCTIARSCHVFQGLQNANELGKGPLMLAGGAAGAVYWLCVYPADIVKSKLQTDNFRRPAFKSSLDCARQVTSSARTCQIVQKHACCLTHCAVARGYAPFLLKSCAYLAIQEPCFVPESTLNTINSMHRPFDLSNASQVSNQSCNA